MVDPRTLRGRLTLAYASALVFALLVFALLALAALDRAQRNALDAQLGTTARAARAIVASNSGRIRMDATDLQQFAAIVGARVSGAIFRGDGSVLATSVSEIPVSVRVLARQAPHTGFETLAIAGDPSRVYVLPIADRVDGGAVVVWHDVESISRLDAHVAIGFALAIPLVVALAMVAAGQIARRGLAPLEAIAALASEIEARDLSRRLAARPRNDELGRLVATFDRMLDRLQAAFERERRFTSDASHELRAPLSVIRAEADLALRRERPPAEYRAALETIATEADALEELTRDLLAVARADHAALPRAPLDLAAVAASGVARLTVLARARGVQLCAALDGPALILGSRTELERVVVTVVHNAIKFARCGVEVRLSRDGGTYELCVADDGRGFSPEAMQHAFDRFWRDDESRGTEGTGLGLALTKSIVASHGGTVALQNARGGGAIVRLRLPAQPPGASS